MSAVWSRDGAGAVRSNSVRCIETLTCEPQDEDLWDDTELIRAYDEAVRSFKVRLLAHAHRAHVHRNHKERTVSRQTPDAPLRVTPIRWA